MASLDIDAKSIIALGGLALVGYFVLKRDIKAGVAAFGNTINKFNPANDDSVIYTHTQKLADAIVGADDGIQLTPSARRRLANIEE